MTMSLNTNTSMNTSTSTKATRRGHHEGSIYQRGDGRWTATITLGYVDGKRKRKSFYGQTRREVQVQLITALQTQQQGLPLPNDRQTLGIFLDRWLADVARPSTRPKTYRVYEQIVRLYLKPGLGHVALTKLNPQEVQALLNNGQAAGLSPRTIHHVHALLRGALNHAMRWGLVARNVATLVTLPHIPQVEITPLDPQQARIFLEALAHERLQALFLVPLAVGLRPGEALGLCWQDVNFATGTLTIYRALQRIEGRLQLVEVKTKRSRRVVSLPAVALQALTAHQARQREERLRAGDLWKETGLIFTTSIGTPIEPRTAVRIFKRILRDAGLPDRRFYDLRHTCATLLLVQGVHPRVVMEILGHSQISLTMNTYSHVVPTLQQEAARRMDEILS